MYLLLWLGVLDIEEQCMSSERSIHVYFNFGGRESK